jgi:CRP-like cAMP-binding protein
VVARAAGYSIEVGLIGREGMTGQAIVMGADRTLHETFIQNAGEGLRLPASKLRQAIEKSKSLHRACLLYAYAYNLQVSYTAMSNGRNKVEERLARWLLMAHDRVEGGHLSLTHGFLALMLAVRRPGVTVALNLLKEAGLIDVRRGTISIVDRKGLEQRSNGAYGPPVAEFIRLFG